jgi:hypothetical protein
MPKDSHLLTPRSRALLRAARAGCIYIGPTKKNTADEEKEAVEEDDAMVIMNGPIPKYTARKWPVIPRHLEPPKVEFLAKKRPGLPSLYGATQVTAPVPAPMRKTKFKKVDPATGNVSIYEVWVPEGHFLEGEITETIDTEVEDGGGTLTAEALVPGTAVKGIGVVDSEGVVVAALPKKRPPPPKRKAKGVGKGRKKKVMFAPEEGADASLVHTIAKGTAPDKGHAPTPGTKLQTLQGCRSMATHPAKKTSQMARRKTRKTTMRVGPLVNETE